MRIAHAALAALLVGAPSAAPAQGLALVHVATLQADGAEAPLDRPEGVACADEGPLVVADTANGRLVVFPYRDGVIGAGTEWALAELPHPTRVQLSAGGEILVLDRKVRRIGRVGPDGAFRGYLDAQRTPAVVPAAFKAVRGGGVVVLDLAAATVLELDAGGAVLRQVPVPAGGPFTDVAIGEGGALLLLDAGGGAVWSAAPGDASFRPLAQGLRAFTSFPGYLSTEARGRLLVVDQHGAAIVVLGPDGAYLGRQLGFGWKDGLLRYPAQIAVARDADLLVADRENSRVQVFSIVR